jgi:PncC family amidohydrolase
VPGSSDFYRGGIVSYSNEAKIALLGVRPETIAEHGAVSEECAGEMATGACRALDADCAVAVTGIAGPGGGTAEKPVGLVFIASVRKGKAPTVTRNVFPGDRGEVRRQTVETALVQLAAEISPLG